MSTVPVLGVAGDAASAGVDAVTAPVVAKTETSRTAINFLRTLTAWAAGVYAPWRRGEPRVNTRPPVFH
jgi:hypothetical protein